MQEALEHFQRLFFFQLKPLKVSNWPHPDIVPIYESDVFPSMALPVCSLFAAQLRSWLLSE